MTGLWFSPGTLVSFTNKTARHDIAEIFLKMTLNPLITLPLLQRKSDLIKRVVYHEGGHFIVFYMILLNINEIVSKLEMKFVHTTI